MANTVGKQLDRKLDAMAKETARARPVAVRKAGLAMKHSVERARDRAAPSGRLRNVGKSGSRLGVRVDFKGDDTAEVKATGPWQIIERDTKAHTIEPKVKGRGRNRRAGGGVKLPDGGVRRAVPHPGTKGKHPYEKGIEAGKPDAIKTLRNAHTDAVTRGLRS